MFEAFFSYSHVVRFLSFIVLVLLAWRGGVFSLVKERCVEKVAPIPSSLFLILFGVSAVFFCYCLIFYVISPSPTFPAFVSATSTQTDLPPGRETERQKKEGREGKLTVKLEFSENSLTYMDRLLLKKHQR